jgi:tetratricopeptide (TPR) repeat protein
MRFTIHLDLTGWFEVGLQKRTLRTWESVTTESLTLEIRRPPQDMPELENLHGTRLCYRERLRGLRGALISCDSVLAGNLPAIKTVFKAPAGNARAMSFTVELLVGVQERIVSLIVSGSEFGITGIREGFVLAELAKSASPQQSEQLKRGEVPLEWKFERYEPGTRGEFAYVLSDEESYDNRFPTHPLTIVRRRMHWLQQSFNVVVAESAAAGALSGESGAKQAPTLFSRLKQTLGREPSSLRIGPQIEPDQLTIEKPASFAPTLKEVELRLGEDIAEDLRASRRIPLLERQKQYRTRVERQWRDVLKAGNTKLAGNDATATDGKIPMAGVCGLDGKLRNYSGLKEEMQKVQPLLPELMLATSIETETCWTLNASSPHSLPLLKSRDGRKALVVFSSQALADNFAVRKQFVCARVRISVAELWRNVQDPQSKVISPIAYNPCPECQHLPGAVTYISGFESSTRLLEMMVLNSGFLRAKAKWFLQTALGEVELKKRLETLCLAITHIDPGSPEILLEMIRTARILNNSGIVVESAKRILKYSPREVRRLADLLYEPAEQQTQEVEEQKQQMLQQATMLVLLWASCDAAEDYATAIEFFSACIAQKPDDVNAHQFLGSALWYSGEVDRGIDVLSRALLLAPEESGLLSSRGQALVEIGKYEEALSDLDRSLRRLVQSAGLEEGAKAALRAYALNGRGAAYSGLEQSEAAQTDFNESMALCPQNAWLYYNMAIASERQGENDAAIRNYTIALKMRAPKLNPSKRTAALARLAILRPDSDEGSSQ